MESNILAWLSESGISPMLILRSLVTIFVSILFIQSGIDKVINWKGESDFYKSHFSKTFLKNTIPLLMPIITISEILAGFLSFIGLLVYWFTGNTDLAILGMLLSSLSIIQLFLGQRIAKDFAGAAVLVNYFILTIIGLYLYLI